MYFTRRGCLHPTYELSGGGRVLGSLNTRNGWKFEATVQMRGRTLTIRQPSWWRRDFDVIDTATGATVATYEASSFRSTDSVTVGGEVFNLKRSFWGNSAKVSDRTGKELFSVSSLGWLGRKLELTPAPGVEFDESIELLAYLACFAMSLSTSDSAGAATVAAIGG